ncbi:MAG: EF-hand domain-containing protein [Candidatus Obscuribacter sp.]|nr:EF-hand domain-containing protein [Candidatus Obscuribacter sp.]
MTTPELKPALLADRAIVHVGQEPTAEGAYQKLLSETQQVTTGMTDTARSIYSRTLPQISPDQMRDLSIGYASANFKTLDANDNGQIDKEELKVRQALVENIYHINSSPPDCLPLWRLN